MKRLVLLLAVGLGLLTAFVLARAATYAPSLPHVEAAPAVAIAEGAAERLAGSLRIPTVSHEDPAAFDAEAFRALHAYLQATFPRVHQQLEREAVNTHSLLYTWRGTDPSLKPIVLAGHMDVVPVEPGTEAQWQQPAFSGAIADGFIYGRGAIDNKSAVVGTLESVEMLLGENFRPTRTVHLAFGHDEEVGGTKGAQHIAALLETRGVNLEMVVDEGGVIGERFLPGVDKPVATVGIAEKGFVSVELSARVAGGHSSLPPPQTAIGIVSAAIARLEQNQMPARLQGPTRQLVDRVGPEFPFAQRAIFANLWLTRPLVVRNLQGSPTTNAMVRTTTAATIFHAGTKDNVLPGNARAVVNFRILPGDSVAAVLEHVRRVVDDERIEIKTAGAFSVEPSAVSSTESNGFKVLERAIRSVATDAIVAPYLVVGGTDARYYTGLSPSVFRFQPLRLTSADFARMHGSDERIAVRHYEEAIRVYRQLIVYGAGR